MMNLIIVIVVGIVAGWIAGLIWKGSGFGLIWDLVIGIAGSFLGRFIFSLLGIKAYNIIGSIIAAVIGALLLLFIISKIRR